MKFLRLFILGMVLLVAGTTQGQLSVRFNIGSPPQWAPTGHAEARYYYLPDVEAYYDVQSSMFIYYEGRNWVHRSYLPNRFRDYDLYGGYKVVMKDYHGDRPYERFSEQRIQYSKGRNREIQRTIGDRPGRGQFNKKDFRESNQVNRGRGDDNRRGNEKDKNDNRGNGNKNGRGEDNGRNK